MSILVKFKSMSYIKKTYVILATIILFTIILIFSITCIQTKHLFNITQIDPLFYSPEIDNESLTTSIEKLKEVESRVKNEIMQHVIENDQQKTERILTLEQISKSGFLPIEYLEKLAGTIYATENFLEKPTTLNGLRMLISSHKTAYAYNKEISSLINLLETLPNEKYSYKKFIQFGSYTTIETLSYDLKLIKQNATTLINETNKRLMCFTLFYCKDSLNKNKYKTNNYEYTKPSIEDFDILSEENISNAIHYENTKRTGPYIIESACFIDKYIPFYIFKSPSLGFMPKQANENYYHDISAIVENNPNNNYAQALMDKGIYFDDQPESTEYRCTDLRYWVDLSTINYFNTVQKRVDITTIYDVTKLRDYFHKNLQLDSSKKNILIIDNNMIDMSGMLTYLSNSLESYIVNSKYNNKVEPFYLIGMRSAYSLTYNTFSKSVWRINKYPQLTLGMNENIYNVYTTYHALREIYSDDEIKAFHIKTSNYLK